MTGRSMSFEEFERAAHEAFEAIPAEYRSGVDGLVVERGAEAHPHIPDIWTLGHCDTEVYPSDFESADTVRSTIRLYWGSFRKLAGDDETFDWIAEIHETVEHEVKHHLEALAGEDALGDVDAVLEHDFRRANGGDWDPFYYRQGEEVAPDTYVAEDLVFVEITLSSADLALRDGIDFAIQGRWYTIPAPTELGDVHFVRVVGMPLADARVEVVLVRRSSWFESARRLFGPVRPRVVESVAEVEGATP
ncbi:MAG: metallopeptidase family protein [Longimicrobiales bacterium]|nr:metallopeptidase family protein [Longimicrobiales bacterium]